MWIPDEPEGLDHTARIVWCHVRLMLNGVLTPNKQDVTKERQPENPHTSVTVYNEVDTPSYRMRLMDFIRLFLSDKGCEIAYRILSYLYESGVV